MNIKKLGAGALSLTMCAVSAGSSFPYSTSAFYAEAAETETVTSLSAEDILSSLDENDITGSGAFDSNYNYTIYSESIMVVSGSGNMDVLEQDAVFEERSKITTLIIISEGEDPANSIGDYAFNGFEFLKSVYLPDSVKYIGTKAFAYCTSLQNITIPDSLVSISNEAFIGCQGLNEIIIPDSVSYIGEHAFAYCTGLQKISLGKGINTVSTDLNFTYPSVIADAFFNDTSVTEMTMHSITLAEDMSETGVVASLFDYNNTGHLPDIKKITVLGCDNQPDFEDYHSVSALPEYSFAGLKSLESVILPDDLQWICQYSFAGCSSLTDITLPSSLSNIDIAAFSYCNSLENITLPDSLVAISNEAFNGCSRLKEIAVPDNVKYIGEHAFAYCTDLQKITLGKGINTVSSDLNFTFPSVIADAFFNDKSVTEIAMHSITLAEDMPKTGVVTSLFDLNNTGYMPDIKKITVLGCDNQPDFVDYHSVNALPEYSFAGLISLESVILPDDLQWICQYSFAGCSSLTDISLPSSVSIIDILAFSHCSSLQNITLPDSLVSISNEAFSACSRLKEITIPDKVNYIGEHAFAYCTGLQKITLGKGINIVSTDLNFTYPSVIADAFFNDTSVTELNMYAINLGKDMPETGIVASLFDFEHKGKMPSIYTVNILGGNTIPAYSFAGLSDLKKAVLNDSVNKIEDNSFINCTALKTVEYKGTTEQWKAVRYDPERNEALANARIICADSADTNDEILIGDVDKNGIVDLSDLTLLSMYLLKDRELDEKALLCADIKPDGEVDIADLATLKQIVMHAI